MKLVKCAAAVLGSAVAIPVLAALPAAAEGNGPAAPSSTVSDRHVHDWPDHIHHYAFDQPFWG